MTTIEQILLKEGPLLSGDLAKRIQEGSKLSYDASRKQLQRAGSPVEKLSGFFANNQTFFYLESHIDDGRYISSLLNALKSSAKRLFSILKSLEYHKGYLPADEISAYSFSPVSNLIGHKRIDVVLKELVKRKLIEIEGDRYSLGKTFYKKGSINLNNSKAVELAKGFIIDQFMNWAKMIGLVSFDTGTTHSQFGKFQWCYTSPSYIGSITSIRNAKLIPGFVVSDILIGSHVELDDVLFFIEKVKIIKAIKSLPRFIPVLIVDGLSPEALGALKTNGVVVGFVKQLFGEGYSELLKSLISTISNAGAILKKNPGAFFQLMNKIDKLVDGKTNNLRGDVFELAVGYYHSRLCNTLDIGKIIYVDGYQKELDVIAVYPDEVKVAECRGYKRQLTLTEVDNWLKKIVIVRAWLNMVEPYQNKRHVFELWSTGGYTDDAIEKIKIVSSAKKYSVYFYDKEAIIRKAREIPNSKFLAVLKQYFINEDV